MKLKVFSIFSLGVFVLMAFITWQQILVFQMGYRVSALKDSLVNEEIVREELMSYMHKKMSIPVVSSESRSKLSMRSPRESEIRVLWVPSEHNLEDSGRSLNIVAPIRSLFTPPPAQAKR